MTTSGISTFNLDFSEIAEECFERCGKELRTGYDLRTARRSLNLLLLDWANRGINLWTIEQRQIVMATNQGLYPVPVDTVDLLDHVIRQYAGSTNQTDLSITRIAEPTFITLPNKLITGRPIQIYVGRQSGQSSSSSVTLNGDITATSTTISLSDASGLPSTGFIKVDSETIGYVNVSGNDLINCYRGQNGTTAATHSSGASITKQNLPYVYVWPTPPSPGNQYILVYYRLRRMQEVGAGGGYEQDVPFRFLPSLIAGLAYQLSMKLPGAEPRIPILKQDYDEQLRRAMDEDRDRASIRIVPRNMFYS